MTEPGLVEGPAHVSGVALQLHDSLPDLLTTVELITEHGDLVAVRVVAEGTNLGKVNGFLPPTGRTFRSTQSHWFRVENGKLPEHWANRDDLATFLQLALSSRHPATSTANLADQECTYLYVAVQSLP